jgi:hypothetical protein
MGFCERLTGIGTETVDDEAEILKKCPISKRFDRLIAIEFPKIIAVLVRVLSPIHVAGPALRSIAGHQAFLHRFVVAKGLCVEAPRIAEEMHQMRQAAQLTWYQSRGISSLHTEPITGPLPRYELV